MGHGIISEEFNPGTDATRYRGLYITHKPEGQPIRKGHITGRKIPQRKKEQWNGIG